MASSSRVLGTNIVAIANWKSTKWNLGFEGETVEQTVKKPIITMCPEGAATRGNKKMFFLKKKLFDGAATNFYLRKKIKKDLLN